MIGAMNTSYHTKHEQSFVGIPSAETKLTKTDGLSSDDLHKLIDHLKQKNQELLMRVLDIKDDELFATSNIFEIDGLIEENNYLKVQ
jgi:hypothetical protein